MIIMVMFSYFFYVTRNGEMDEVGENPALTLHSTEALNSL